MSIGLVPDWAAFTPWSALAGGALIGLAAAVLLLGSGRIAGIAGLVGLPLRDLLQGQAGGWLARHRLRLLFVAGLLIAPWLWRLAAPLPPMRLDVGTPVLIVAGLLVGFGSRLGNGCSGRSPTAVHAPLRRSKRQPCCGQLSVQPSTAVCCMSVAWCGQRLS